MLAALTLGYFISQWVVQLPVFPFKQVNVSSREAVAAMAATGAEARDQGTDRRRSVRHEVRGNFFTVDLDEVAKRVHKVALGTGLLAVRRIWPQSLEVTLEEHVVLARWGSSALLNVARRAVPGRFR